MLGGRMSGMAARELLLGVAHTEHDIPDAQYFSPQGFRDELEGEHLMDQRLNSLGMLYYWTPADEHISAEVTDVFRLNGSFNRFRSASKFGSFARAQPTSLGGRGDRPSPRNVGGAQEFATLSPDSLFPAGSPLEVQDSNRKIQQSGYCGMFGRSSQHRAEMFSAHVGQVLILEKDVTVCGDETIAKLANEFIKSRINQYVHYRVVPSAAHPSDPKRINFTQVINIEPVEPVNSPLEDITEIRLRASLASFNLSAPKIKRKRK